MNPWRVSAIVVIVHVVVVVVVVIVVVVAVVVVVIIVVELSSSSHESNPKQTLNQAPIGVQQKAGIGFRGKIILMGKILNNSPPGGGNASDGEFENILWPQLHEYKMKRQLARIRAHQLLLGSVQT